MCSASANPLPGVFQWFHNVTRLITNTTKHTMDNFYEQGSSIIKGVLCIRNVTWEDYGVYKCIAKTDIGSDEAVMNFVISCEYTIKKVNNIKEWQCFIIP